jgi:hypothetical protein
MRRGCGACLTLAALAVALFSLPATAQATLTVGSSLMRTANASTSCLPNCTVALTALNPELQAADGIASPVNGTVTTWRIVAGNKSGPTAFRVIRPLAGGTYTGGATSPVVNPALDTLNSYPVNLPIQRGDLLGIDCCASPGSTYFTGTGTGGRAFFEPGFLADGGPGATPSGSDSFEMLLNADIEPTSAFTLTSVRKRKGGKISVTVQLPNPGTLVAGDPHDYALGAPGVKSLLLKAGETDAGPGPVTVTTRTTGRAQDRLAQRGRLKLRVKVVFTPMHGASSAQNVKVKLKTKP